MKTTSSHPTWKLWPSWILKSWPTFMMLYSSRAFSIYSFHSSDNNLCYTESPVPNQLPPALNTAPGVACWKFFPSQAQLKWMRDGHGTRTFPVMQSLTGALFRRSRELMPPAPPYFCIHWPIFCTRTCFSKWTKGSSQKKHGTREAYATWWQSWHWLHMHLSWVPTPLSAVHTGRDCMLF